MNSAASIATRGTRTNTWNWTARDFEKKIYVKQDAGPLAGRDLGMEKIQGEHIAIGTATDPYQPAEREFGATRAILEQMAARRGLSVSITTKSDQVLRDVDLLRRIAEHSGVSVNLSITTLRTRLARMLEPRAPRPDLRMHAVRELRRAGIAAGVFAMPVLPGITDREEDLDALARAARDAGAQWFAASVLFLMPSAQKQFLPFLDAKFPKLARRYREWFSRCGLCAGNLSPGNFRARRRAAQEIRSRRPPPRSGASAGTRAATESWPSRRTGFSLSGFDVRRVCKTDRLKPVRLKLSASPGDSSSVAYGRMMRGSSLATPTSLGNCDAQKFDERARARPPVGAQPPETEKEHQEVENFRVLQRGKLRMLRRVFLFLLDEFRERGIKPRGHGNLRRFFVVNSGEERAARLRHGLHGGEHVRVGEGTLIRGVDEHGVSKARQHGLPRVNQIGGERYVRERDFAFGERFRMALLPAVRRDQIGAIARAVDGHFALGSAVDGADFFALGGAIALGAPLVADRADFFVGHSWLLREKFAVRSWDLLKFRCSTKGNAMQGISTNSSRFPHGSSA